MVRTYKPTGRKPGRKAGSGAKPPTPLPELAYLQECFFVVSGVLIWRERPRSHFQTGNGFEKFNEQHAGKPAGHVQADRVTVRQKVYSLKAIIAALEQQQ